MGRRVPDTITDQQWRDLCRRAQKAAPPDSVQTGRRRAAYYTQRRKAEQS